MTSSKRSGAEMLNTGTEKTFSTNGAFAASERLPKKQVLKID